MRSSVVFYLVVLAIATFFVGLAAMKMTGTGAYLTVGYLLALFILLIAFFIGVAKK